MESIILNRKSIKSIACFAVILMTLSIIPSGAFAADNGTSTNHIAINGTREMPGPKMMGGNPGPGGNESGNESDGMPGMGPGGFDGDCIIDLASLEDADEDNFSEIQAEILEQLSNQIERMSNVPEMPEMPGNSTNEDVDDEALEAMEEARSEAQAEKLDELNSLYDEIESAESLDELKAIVLSQETEKMSDSIDRQIEKLENMMETLDSNQNENVTEELLEETIGDLQDLQEQLSSAESSEDLKEIREALQEINDSFRETIGIEAEEGFHQSSMRTAGNMHKRE
jgi:hypothetical protein